jgi:hypothetical protein
MTEPNFEDGFYKMHVSLLIVTIIVIADLLFQVLVNGISGMRPVHIAVIFFSSLITLKVFPQYRRGKE